MKKLILILLLIVILLSGCSDKNERPKTYESTESSTETISNSVITESKEEIESTETTTERDSAVSLTQVQSVISETRVTKIETDNEKSTSKKIKKGKTTTAVITKQDITKKSRRFVTTSKSTTQSYSTTDLVSKSTENNNSIILISEPSQLSTTNQTTTPVTTNIQRETISVTVKCDCKNAIDHGFSSDTIPQNGEIFQESVFVEQGTSALDAIKFACLQSGTSITEKRGYISEIGGLKEKDCDGLGGWLYKVNGELPNYSSDKYKLNDGDVVELIYTVKIGDVK